jgi:AraC-like DNA-binding protein
VNAVHGPRAFLADPVGHYVAGRSFAVWAQSPSLLGAVYFGRIDPADYGDLTELFDLHPNPSLAPPYDTLQDGGALLPLDPAAFDLFLRYAEPRWRSIADALRRMAVVRPAGLAGAIVAGIFYDRLPRSVQAALFTDRAEALDWLGVRATSPARVEIDELMSSLDSSSPLVRRLRVYLQANLRDAELASAGRALSCAPRSLQRTLHDAGTSVRAELDRARVRAAESLLLDGDAKIEAIAHEVGCASPSAFYELFRRCAGETPADFRARRR